MNPVRRTDVPNTLRLIPELCQPALCRLEPTSAYPISTTSQQISFLSSLHHGRRVLLRLKSTSTVLTANTDSAPVEIICDIFRHAIRLPLLNCDEKSRILFREHLGILLALTGSCAPLSPRTTLWTDIFVDVISPDLLRLHLECSAGLRLNVFITDPHLATHSIICDEAYRFRRSIMDDMKLPPIWGDTFPSAASHLEELRIDAHPGYPSLGFLVPAFDGSLPEFRSLQLRDVPFWSTGMFKGLKHLEFADGAQTLPLFIPLILGVLQASPLLEMLFIRICCILPDLRYVYTVATLPNLRLLRVTSDAFSMPSISSTCLPPQISR